MTALCLWVAWAAAEDAKPKPLVSFSVKREGAVWPRIQWMAYTPGGALAVRYADTPGDPIARTGDATLGVFDPATGKRVVSAAIKDGGWIPRAACAIGPGGAWIAYAEPDQLKFLSLPPGKPALPGDGSVKVRGLIAGSGVWADPKGAIAFLYDDDFELPILREWDLAKQSERREVRVAGIDGEISGYHLDPRGRQLAVAGKSREDATCWIENRTLADPPAVVAIKTDKRAISIAHSPDGKVLAAGFGDGAVAWYDLGTGKPVRRVPPLGRLTVGSVAFHPGGKHLACGTYDGKGAANLFLLDAATGGVLARLTADPHGVTLVGFDATGDRLAAAGSTGTVTVWDAAALLKLRRD